MSRLPFTSNENGLHSTKGRHLAEVASNDEPPWQVIKANEHPPPYFQVHCAQGLILSYAYCDLREMRLLSPGYLQLHLLGMEKWLITIEGRHLSKLHNLLCQCRVVSLQELGERSFVRPEECPSIDKVRIEDAETGEIPY